MKNYDILRVEERVKNGKELRITINASFEEIERYLNILREEVLRDNADFLVLKEACAQILSRVPLPMHIYSDSFILRSRPNFDGEIFNHESQISYNPILDLINLNRFNLEREQLFYGAAPISSDNADGALTTICESYKDLLDVNSTFNRQYLTIGKWNVIKPIKLVMLTFYDVAWKKSQHVQNINPVYHEFLELSCTPEDNRKCQLVYCYFSECAGKKNDTANNYLLTTAFYHAVREQYGAETGILYSSSSTENFGLNIALSKEIIDAGYLKLNHVAMYKCERNPSNKMNFKIFPCSKGADVDANGKFQILRIT